MKLAVMMRRPDVDALLDEMSPRQFEEWFIAYQKGILHEDEWLQAGVIAATIHNELTRITAILTQQKLRDEDIADPQDFTPLPKRKKPKKKFDAKQFIKRVTSGNSRNT